MVGKMRADGERHNVTDNKRKAGITKLFNTIFGGPDGSSAWTVGYERTIRSIDIQGDVLTLVCSGIPQDADGNPRMFPGDAMSYDAEKNETTFRIRPEFENIGVTGSEEAPTIIRVYYRNPGQDLGCILKFSHKANIATKRAERLAQAYLNRIENIPRKNLPALLSSGDWRLSHDFSEQVPEPLRLPAYAVSRKSRLCVNTAVSVREFFAKRTTVRVWHDNDRPVEISIERWDGVRLNQLLRLVRAD